MAYKVSADSQAENFEKLFTGNKHLLDRFANFVASKELPKGILIIHGVGGVGKSSLLRMYRLHCKRTHVPVAMTSGDEAKSAVDILSNWSNDLKTDGITLRTFQKTLSDYRAIQANVEIQVRKEQESQKKATEKAGMAVASAVIAAVSLIPGGQIVDLVGGIGVEALVDWLRRFLAKPDIEMLIDPVKLLTRSFLEDIGKVAQKRRLVLMLDTFEQMSALNDWVCDTVQQLDSNILFVIAGREMVNWDHRWGGWLTSAEVVELEPMSDEDMRELAHRYYAATAKGEPDPKQMEAIVAFAGGLPMVVATAVRLWVTYGRGFDIDEQRTEIFSDVVNRLREGIPTEYVPILESASIVRWFNESILHALTKQDDVDAAYKELSKFSFVKSSRDGFTLHDSVREILEKNIRTEDSKHYKDLHERAANYFKTEMERAPGEEGWNLGLEWLYHTVRVDEKSGLQKYQQIAEGLLGYRQKDRLLILLNDLDSYITSSSINPIWLPYFRTRLDGLDKDDDVEFFLGRVVAQEPNKTSQTLKSEKPLRVFLCHSSDDKPKVKQLFDRLILENGIDPWLDVEKLLPGVDWDLEIKSAVKASHVVLVCLSKNSINKEGYIQKEIRQALDVADEKPDRTIFIIPLRLENCEVPERLKRWQWLDLFEKDSYNKLLISLRKRANDLVTKKLEEK